MKIILSSILASMLLVSHVSADKIQDAQKKMQENTEKAMETTDVESQFSSNSTVGNATRELTQSFNLGFASTSGNTDTLNFNALYKGDMITEGYNDKDLKIGYDFSGYITKTGDSKKVEEYAANLGVEQYMMDGWFTYASLNWYRNEILGYKNKFSVGAGLGKQLFSDEIHSLRLKLGLAQNFADFANLSSAVSLDTENYATVNQYIEYNRVINDTSNFYAKIGAQESFEDFSDIEGVGVLGLNFSVADKVSVSIEEEVRYNGLGTISNLLDNKANTKTVVRIGYNF